MTDATYRIAHEPGRVRLSGDFDINARDDLREVLVRAVHEDDSRTLVVDFAETEFIDSEALGALIDGFTTAQANEVTMSIANARGLVHRVLDVSGVLDLFD